MKYKGKIIGTLVGLIFGSPITMALGFIAGHLYDLGYFHAFAQAGHGGAHTQAQQIFFNSTFTIMGYIAKSDGRVSENEIQTARSIMSRMGLNEDLKKQAIHLFSVGKESDFNPDPALFELRTIGSMQPALLQLFLDIQLQMASADGQLSREKKHVLEHICEKLGVSGVHFNTSGNYYQHHYQHQRATTHTDTLSANEAYQLLGVAPTATPDEIKTAYRRLMSQNHPDKLIAKGLPPEMIKVATEKTQRIKKAYEQIKKLKNMH